MSQTFVLKDLDYFNYNFTEHYEVDPKTLSCKLTPLDASAALTLCILLFLIFLLAIPGNVLVGWVIWTSTQPLTPSDVYLFHLTIADGLLALTLPFVAVSLVYGWVFGDFLCKFLSLVIEANFYTSIIFLACISVDRYRVIVRASETRRAGQRRCSRALCVAVWVIGWALALPALFNDAIELNSSFIICAETFDMGSSTLWRLSTRGFRHIFGFLVPLVVMVACYSITIARLLHTRGFQKHRAMRVIIAVVIAFLLCWIPYHITMVVDTLLRADLLTFNCAVRKGVDKALLTTKSLTLVHSCINPFLYAFVGEKFRKRLKELLQRKLRQEQLSTSRFSRSTSHTSEGARTVL